MSSRRVKVPWYGDVVSQETRMSGDLSGRLAVTKLLFPYTYSKAMKPKIVEAKRLTVFIQPGLKEAV